MTGSEKIEKSKDLRHYQTHKDLKCPDGKPILNEKHNYITIRGYYNCSDQEILEQKKQLCRPVDLKKALQIGIFHQGDINKIIERVHNKLKNINYDGSLLEPNDMIISYNPKGEVVKDDEGFPDVRMTNFEFIKKI